MNRRQSIGSQLNVLLYFHKLTASVKPLQMNLSQRYTQL